MLPATKSVAIMGLTMGLLIGCTEAVTKSQDQAKQIKCVSILKRISVAAILYSNAHDAFPNSLQDLIDARDLQARDLHCPAAAALARECDFFYFQPTASSRGSALMACDLDGNHPNGDRGCVTVTGAVQWLTDAEFQAELAKEENAAFGAALAEANR
ncbi:MAG: hypothetical protein ACYTFO_09855 [Planctomycetota bacterium]|jgi:hypothetical protein